ncbi:MAG: fused MFS/spermidine synthase, partial [Candidatus Hydrothermarchaeaceae archaeon]
MLETIILLGFYLSGFAALTYEQVWTQLLFLVFGNSTYAFSVMLTAFFIGLALGSYIMGRYVDRLEFPILWFAFIELGIGLFGLVLLPAFSMLDLPYLMFFQKIQSPYLFMLSWSLLPFWLLVPTTLMGATLPLVSKILVSEREKIGAQMGLLYSANTLGGVVGSFSAGFILIPYLGLVKTCVLAALANIIVAFVIFFYYGGLLQVRGIYKTRKARYFINMKRGFYFFLAVSLILSFHISSYKINPTFAGAYYAGMRMATLDEWKEAKEGFDILYSKYGRYGLVVVGTDETDVRYLTVNGKTEASTGLSDMPTQYLIAYIPMLVHKDPEKVLNIGLGAGFTLSAIENFDVEKIDVIEIDPIIVSVAEEYFSEYNRNALDDPRLNLVIADGRNYLQHSPEKYDVIISEPSNPWISGEGNLFTLEFFEIVRGHLNENGIFSQWVPMYEHDVEDFKILLKTFHSVFPYVQVYNSGTDIILLGSNEAMTISYPRLVEQFKDPELSRDFSEISYLSRQTLSSNIDEFLSTYKMGSDDVHEYVKGDIRLNTDEHTVLEFRTALNAVKSRYSDDLSVVVDPLRDMLNFMTKRHGSP